MFVTYYILADVMSQGVYSCSTWLSSKNIHTLGLYFAWLSSPVHMLVQFENTTVWRQVHEVRGLKRVELLRIALCMV